jgi:hypothetical protein
VSLVLTGAIGVQMKEISFAKKLSIGLFTIGTIILLVFAATLSALVGIIRYVYTGFAVLIGMFYLIMVVRNILRKEVKFLIGIKSIGILAINIPIVVFYFYVVTVLVNTARITFENTTGRDLTSIKIFGCEGSEIELLEAGKSKTIWIEISHDCSLEIQYETDGQNKREVVAGYLTTSNGIIATYKIGSGQEILF